MDKNLKIYVAGHQGMVGSAVLRRLEAEGHKNILVRDRKDLDLTDQKMVADFFAQTKPDYVILCAARVGGIKANMTYPADFLYENLAIQNNIIWSAHIANVKKLLFLGSSCIYPRTCPQPIKEEYLLNGKLEPTNEGYALAKIAGIKLCEKIFEQYNKTFISCMPTNIYGINYNYDPDSSHVIPSLIKRFHEAKILKKESVAIWGTGETRREFMFVDDLADAIYFLMDKYDEKELINVGIGSDVSIKELAILISKVVGYQGRIEYDTTKPDGMPRKLLDVSKLNDLSWASRTSLEEGLKIAYEWYLKNNLNKCI